MKLEISTPANENISPQERGQELSKYREYLNTLGSWIGERRTEVKTNPDRFTRGEDDVRMSVGVDLSAVEQQSKIVGLMLDDAQKNANDSRAFVHVRDAISSLDAAFKRLIREDFSAPSI